MSNNEATVIEADGKIYLFTRDDRGAVEWGLVLTPEMADELAGYLKRKASQARSTVIEGRLSTPH